MHLLLKEELFKYATLSEEEWQNIQNKFILKKIKKNNYFLKAGQICRNLGFINQGFFRTYTINLSGDEITTHFAYDSSFMVSFFSFKNQSASFEYIQALEDSEYLEISYQNLHKLFSTSNLWRTIYQAIIENAYACMEERSYILQNLSATEKYSALIENGHPSILQKASLGHISSYLGIKQETLSRIRKKHTQIPF